MSWVRYSSFLLFLNYFVTRFLQQYNPCSGDLGRAFAGHILSQAGFLPPGVLMVEVTTTRHNNPSKSLPNFAAFQYLQDPTV